MKSALLIGGIGALGTSESLVGFTGTARAEPITVGERDNRQHAWNDFITESDEFPGGANFHVLLYLTYQKDGEPTADDRAEMENALRQLEEAYEWNEEGLLFTVNYGQPYFDRFDESLPKGARLLDNQESIDAMVKRTKGEYEEFEDPVAEPYDIFINLASDNVTNLLGAEEALWGNRDEINGVTFEHTFEGLFEKPEAFPDRRTGFVGIGVAGNETEEAQKFDEFGNPNEDIPDKAQLTMGFNSAFEDNGSNEDIVSLIPNQQFDDGEARPPGQFAQGTIQHASRLEIELITWYDDNLTSRRTRMFSPFHGLAETGQTARELGERSSPDEFPMRDPNAETDAARQTIESARAVKEVVESEGEEGLEEAVEAGTVIGHSQKLARARVDHSTREIGGDSDSGVFQPRILRRDFNTLDGTGEHLPNQSELSSEERDIPPNSALNFLSLMRFNEDMVITRQAMNDIGFTSADGSIDHEDMSEIEAELDSHGIQEYILATRRGNFLMPPITLRSLPTPRALDVKIDIKSARNDTIPVEIRSTDDVGVHSIDPKTLRFGARTEVDQGRGAGLERLAEGSTDEKLTALFPTGETGFEEGGRAARLFGKTWAGVAVTAETEMNVANVEH